MKRELFFLPACLLFVVFTSPLSSLQHRAEPEIVSRSAVVMDAATGTLVFYKNPDAEIPPASLTKLMTMHLAFREIAAGRASLDEIIVPHEESWAVNQPYRSSLMFLANGQRVTLRELLLGMAVSSGNDAAAAVALRFAPSVEAFAELMNREAQALGLKKTRFVEPSGISEHNMTSARDFAVFCRVYLEAHPEALSDYHSVRRFAYPLAGNVAEPFRDEPGTIVQENRNTLLGKVQGVDGFKTGYIDEAGYNIALTASRAGTRFIAVILGAPAEWGGDTLRDTDGEKLLEWAFSNYRTVKIRPPLPEPVRVWKGEENYAELKWGAPLDFTVSSERGEKLSWRFEAEEYLEAPLPSGHQAGTLVLYDSLGELRRIPVVTSEETEEGGFFKRIFDSIRLFFIRLFGG